jgi:hypothetical protein
MKGFALTIGPHSRWFLRVAAWIGLMILILATLLLMSVVANHIGNWFTGSFPHLNPLWEGSPWSR